MAKRSWADQQGISKGVLGTVYKGVPITEDHRVTNFAQRRAGIKELQDLLKKNYQGVHAVLFGVFGQSKEVKYAIFVHPEFLEDY